MEKFRNLIAFIKTQSTPLRVLAVLIVTAIACFLFFCSCTSTRNVSLSVDKAESVHFNIADSLNVPLNIIP